MCNIYEDEATEGVILIDASNAFNSVNRNTFLHNIRIICPSLAMFVKNCYSTKSRLFIIGGGELKSSEGTTQGDPVSMAVYDIAIIPLILIMVDFSTRDKQTTKCAGYADDVTAAGKLNGLRRWWERLCEVGPKFGYYPNAGKTWLITTDELYEEAIKIFTGTNINLTTEGKRHLGAVIGKERYKSEYLSKKIDDWIDQLRVLCEIAKMEPQSAYCAFVSSFKHKMSFYMRTIPNIGDQMKRLDEVVTAEFIPAITGGLNCSGNVRKLMSLPPNMGGLSIPIFSNQAPIEYENSKTLTKNLSNNIINQVIQLEENNSNEDLNKLKSQKRKRNKDLLERIRGNMDETQKRLNDLACEKGASIWLTTLPIAEEGYALNKQTFWDLIRVRYGLSLSRQPTKCVCGNTFDLQHALSCKRGGFVTLRHNEVRNITANLLKDVCKDVMIEPMLAPLTGEALKEPTAVKGNEARLDIRARGFWQAGQMALFDVRVFNPMAKRFANQSLAKAYESNEKEKKRSYNERVLEIEHGSFTPLIFSAMGGMGRECGKFYTRLAEAVADKRRANYADTITWVRRKISFSLCRSIVICLRGSRSVFDTMPIVQKEIHDSETFVKMS